MMFSEAVWWWWSGGSQVVGTPSHHQLTTSMSKLTSDHRRSEYFFKCPVGTQQSVLLKQGARDWWWCNCLLPAVIFHQLTTRLGQCNPLQPKYEHKDRIWERGEVIRGKHFTHFWVLL